MEETHNLKSKSEDIAVCHNNLSSKIRIINFPIEQKIQTLNCTTKRRNNDNVLSYQRLNARISFIFTILLFITFGVIVYSILKEENDSKLQNIQTSNKLPSREHSITDENKNFQDFIGISKLTSEIQSPALNYLKYRVRRNILNKPKGINDIGQNRNYHGERQTEEMKYKNDCKAIYNNCQEIFAYMNKEPIRNFRISRELINAGSWETNDYKRCVECQKMEQYNTVGYRPTKSTNDNHVLNYYNHEKLNTVDQYPSENRQRDNIIMKKVENPSSFVDIAQPTDTLKNKMIEKSSASTAPVKYYIPFPTTNTNEITSTGAEFTNPMSARNNRDTNTDAEIIYPEMFENESFPGQLIDIRSTETNQVNPKVLSNPSYQSGIMSESKSAMIPTAETMKTGQQLQLTPISVLPYSVCFYSVPPAVYPQPRQSQSSMMYPSAPPSSGFPPSSSAPRAYQNPTQYPSQHSHVIQGQGFVPFQTLGYEPAPVQSFANSPQLSSSNIGYNDQKVGPTGPGQSFVDVSYPRPVYCAFMPTFQFPSVPGDYQRSSGPSDNLQGRESYTPYNRENNVDNNLLPSVAPSHNVNTSNCKFNYLECLDKSACVLRSYWCDGIVHCPDASDETRCSCKDRIIKDRLCDGYFDCPHGEDELGCFGCPQNAFNCEDWTKLNQQGNCLTLSQRCDGIKQCRNGKDEIDCTALINNEIMDDEDIFTIGYNAGYLYKNYQGKWYPACTPTKQWAIESCAGEIGTPSVLNQQSPQIMTVPAPISQNQSFYISKLLTGEISLVQGCNKQAIFVNCPEIPCGTRVNSAQVKYRSNLRFEDILVASPHLNVTQNRSNDNRTDESMENEEMEKILFEQEQSSVDSRIVGGRASEPKAWPSIVAIYRNGLYKCGGVILNTYWILTAAHCLEKHHLHYYRIHAGLLRRFSFSPMEQTRRAEFIITHPKYVSSLKLNDLGLIKLNEPLRFNRWIRSICIPNNSPNFNPIPGQICTTIGWGSTAESGPEPDHLREVEIPILSSCKQSSDNTAAVICAGKLEGGKDACQGDSGGPLMCKLSEVIDQWYVAGIVSHGVGCARPDEPGAYTNVGYFSPWINYTMYDNQALVGPKPLDKCPGFRCDGGFGKCLPSRRRCDKQVDCIDAEDEINCPHYINPGTFRNANEPTSDSFDDFNNQNESYSPVDGVEVWTKKSTIQLGNVPISTTTNSTTDSILNTVASTNMIEFTDQIITTIEPSSIDDDLVTAAANFSEQPSRFTCKKLIQSITMSARCNKIIDCEDGTDEVNCTCKDILMNIYPTAVCNGRVDCYDSTDEKDCNFCEENEFICVRSGSCILQSKKCDNHVDCPLGEDELDCFHLLQYPLLDNDNRPVINTPGEGIIIQEVNGVWKTYCTEDPETDSTRRFVNQVCQNLGFKGISQMSVTPTRNSTLLNEFEEDDMKFYVPESNSKLELSTQNKTDECVEIVAECRKALISPANSYLYKNISDEDSPSHMWPWLGAIFLDGKNHCPAILLRDEWFLTSLRCTENIDLSKNITRMIAGLSPAYKYVPGPYEDMKSVLLIKPIKEFNVSLINTNPCQLSRYIQPIFTEERFSAANAQDECFAIGTDSKFKTTETPFGSVPDGCLSCDRCFKRKINDEECKNETHGDWSGIVTCRGSSGWYPAAVFHEKDMICGFQTTQSLMSIDQMFPYLMDAMDNGDSSEVLWPNCDGVTCLRGKCLPWKNVCDGIQDCEKAEDETPDICEEKRNMCNELDTFKCECSESELKCGNGECIPKEMFCDGKADCSDETDEPTECNCGEYLKLTAPERVCDNIRHCYDKTDEQNCNCEDNTYRCIDSDESQCIPYDFLCDGDKDCKNGDDESLCRMIKNNPKSADFGGEVLRRSFGVWHTECFPTPIETNVQAQQICQSFGFPNGTIVSIDEAAPQGPAIQPEFDDFFMIRLSDQWAITTRGAKPLVKLVAATNECHRAFIKCL